MLLTNHMQHTYKYKPNTNKNVIYGFRKTQIVLTNQNLLFEIFITKQYIFHHVWIGESKNYVEMLPSFFQFGYIKCSFCLDAFVFVFGDITK